MNPRARKILVTGGSGFIGRHIVALLVERGYAVCAAGRAKSAMWPDAVEWRALDLFDAVQCERLMAEVRPDALMHMAWTATPGKFWTDPDNLDWVAASLLLTRAFARHGGRRAVYAGTCAEYDWRLAKLDELSTPLHPHTLYGQAKKSLFELLQKAGAQLDLSIAWGRIFFLYGDGEARGRLVSDTIASLLEGRPALCSEGTQLRDFMHVQDVAGAFVALLESEVTGAVNIASGRSRPLRDVITLIGEHLDGSGLIRLGARPMQAGEPLELSAVTERLEKEVGFRPTFDLASGLAQVCARARASRPMGVED